MSKPFFKYFAPAHRRFPHRTAVEYRAASSLQHFFSKIIHVGARPRKISRFPTHFHKNCRSITDGRGSQRLFARSRHASGGWLMNEPQVRHPSPPRRPNTASGWLETTLLQTARRLFREREVSRSDDGNQPCTKWPEPGMEQSTCSSNARISPNWRGFHRPCRDELHDWLIQGFRSWLVYRVALRRARALPAYKSDWFDGEQ